MPGARAAVEGARVQRLSELAAGALQAAALQAVLTLADRLMEMSCADLLEATKPPPALVGKADESWGVFGSDSEEDAEDGGGREADGAELAEPASGAADGAAEEEGATRERAAATAAVAGLREAVAALREAAGAVIAKPPPTTLVGKEDASWGVFGSDSDEDEDDDEEEDTAVGDGDGDSSGAAAATTAAAAAAAAAAKAAVAAHSAAAHGWSELQATSGWSNPAWREVFCLSSVAGAVASVLVSSLAPAPGAGGEEQPHRSQLQDAMRAADLAFILGCPPEVCGPVCALLDQRLRPVATATATMRPPAAAAAAAAATSAASTPTPSACRSPLGVPKITRSIARIAQVCCLRLPRLHTPRMRMCAWPVPCRAVSSCMVLFPRVACRVVSRVVSCRPAEIVEPGGIRGELLQNRHGCGAHWLHIRLGATELA
eukprot:COSAG06_NODE_1966_length_7960_cov_20.489632_6_plen_431_part_00